VRRIADLDGDRGRLEAVVLGLVDGVAEGDADALAAAFDALRDARARAEGDDELVGWLDAATAFASWGLERAPSRAPVARGTRAYDFVSALGGEAQLGSAQLRGRLGVDDTQVSRTGRRLLEQGLVARSKVGREVFWALTPRGRRALAESADQSDGPAASPSWRAALERGFDAAQDPQHEPDPTRRRVIEATFALHQRHGVHATPWLQIAREAGVAEETLNALFPTQDDLVRGCGEYLVERVRLPPADRAAEVFAGATSEPERVRRLVEALFGAYERGGGALTVGRRERNDIPLVDESVQVLEATFDALAAEALGPRGADGAVVASLRGLTDLEVWRTLREQGATPEAAVDQAVAAVERWLAAQPV
jgi:AcrR family transcriptional regulator